MRFIDIWVWWVGLWNALGKVWYQTWVQCPLKVCTICVLFLGLVLQQCFLCLCFSFVFILRAIFCIGFFIGCQLDLLLKTNGCHFNLNFQKKWIVILGYLENSMFTKSWLNKWPRNQLILQPNYIRCQLGIFKGNHVATHAHFIKKNLAQISKPYFKHKYKRTIYNYWTHLYYW
jgi:hypothetical protein